MLLAVFGWQGKEFPPMPHSLPVQRGPCPWTSFSCADVPPGRGETVSGSHQLLLKLLSEGSGLLGRRERLVSTESSDLAEWGEKAHWPQAILGIIFGEGLSKPGSRKSGTSPKHAGMCEKKDPWGLIPV